MRPALADDTKYRVDVNEDIKIRIKRPCSQGNDSGKNAHEIDYQLLSEVIVRDLNQRGGDH
jgi:hypothetical protein